MATRPSLRNSSSTALRSAPSVFKRCFAIYAGLLTVSMLYAVRPVVESGRWPLSFGIVFGTAAVILAPVMLEPHDMDYYWGKGWGRSAALYALLTIVVVALLYLVAQMVTVKALLPEMEAEWRCLHAKELHDDGEVNYWCQPPRVGRARKSYLGDDCIP